MKKQVVRFPGSWVICVGQYPEGRSLPMTAVVTQEETTMADGWTITDDQIKEYLLYALQEQMDEVLEAKYGKGTQISMLFIERAADSTADQKAQVWTAWAWINGVLEYYRGIKKLIAAGTTDQLCALRWDFSDRTKAAPEVALDSIMEAKAVKDEGVIGESKIS